MWLLPCYGNSRCLLWDTALSVGLLLCSKVQELSMFHVLKVGGTRNATNTRKKTYQKERNFLPPCHTYTHTEVVCVGRYQPLSGTSFQLALTHRNFYFVTFSASYVALPLSLPFGNAFNYT